MKEMEHTGIIYRALNLRNGKSYIGETLRPLEKRIISHQSDAKRNSPQYFHKLVHLYCVEDMPIRSIAKEMKETKTFIGKRIKMLKRLGLIPNITKPAGAKVKKLNILEYTNNEGKT